MTLFLVFAIIYSITYRGEFLLLVLIFYWGLFVYFLLKIVGTIIGIIGSMKNWKYLVLGVSTLFETLLFVFIIFIGKCLFGSLVIIGNCILCILFYCSNSLFWWYLVVFCDMACYFNYWIHIYNFTFLTISSSFKISLSN